MAKNASGASRVLWMLFVVLDRCACLLVGMFLWVDMWTAHLRVDVLLADQSLENPNYIGQWQMFLPSDVCLGCMFEL